MTVGRLIKLYGCIEHKGKKYVLTENASIEGPVEEPYYTAMAICPEDGVDEYGLYPLYRLTWKPKEEWLKSDRTDEGWACDWSSPSEVVRQNAGYNLEEGRTV